MGKASTKKYQDELRNRKRADRQMRLYEARLKQFEDEEAARREAVKEKPLLFVAGDSRTYRHYLPQSISDWLDPR